jgi:hypothetical protein
MAWLDLIRRKGFSGTPKRFRPLPGKGCGPGKAGRDIHLMLIDMA